MERHRKIQRHKKGKVTADKQRQREKEEIGKAKDKETKMTAKTERHRNER